MFCVIHVIETSLKIINMFYELRNRLKYEAGILKYLSVVK